MPFPNIVRRSAGRRRSLSFELLESRVYLSGQPLPGLASPNGALDPSLLPLSTMAESSHASGTAVSEAAAATALTSSDSSRAVQSINQFAADLYTYFQQQTGNLFLSPMSIVTALAMTAAGARGQTATQMADVLHFGQSPGIDDSFHALLQSLNPSGGSQPCELSVANSLWTQQGYPFLSDFLQLVQSGFGGGAQNVDYRANAEGARQTINDWVAQQTHDKIKDLFSAGSLDPLTRLVLTNAIYFKGQWATKVDAALTHNQSFYLSPGQTVDVPMMHIDSPFRYEEQDGYQVLDLPYQGDNLSMIVLLPKDATQATDLSGDTLARINDSLSGNLRTQEVIVTLPKFTTTVSSSLTKLLSSIGMSDAFNRYAADFTGMANPQPDGNLYISVVVHKAFVEVNEEGTEATAATGVGITTPTCVVADPPPPVIFTADHPFQFYIRDNRTGAILFMGRMSDPSKQQNDVTPTVGTDTGHGTTKDNQPPSFTLTGPTPAAFAADQSISIQWTAQNVPAGSKISLCYDADGVWNGNERWIEIDQAAAQNGSGNFQWNLSGIKPGKYYVAGYLFSDGRPTYSRLAQAITVQPPTFNLTGPLTGTFDAGDTVPIQWMAGGVAAGSKISLCYDADAGWWNGNEHWIVIGQAVSGGTGSFDWDTTGVKPGKYYVAGYLYTGSGAPVYAHMTQPIVVQSTGTPTFNVAGPDSGRFAAGDSVTISWSAANFPAGAKISLCADEDGGLWNGNEHWIEVEQVDPAVGSYVWHVPTNFNPRKYYIAGYMHAADGTLVYSHLVPSPDPVQDQSITIKSAGTPTFNLLAPPAPETITQGDKVTISWSATNIPAGSTVSLCYDEDAKWWNGNEHWIEIDRATATGGTYTWDTTGMAPGTYYVAGYMFANGVPVYSHSMRSITIKPASAADFSFSFTGPPSGTYAAGDTVTISWLAAHVPANASIKLDLTYGERAITPPGGVSVTGTDSG